MAIVAVDLGSSPSGAGGDNNREAFGKVNDSVLELDERNPAALEGVSGGAGFVNVSGAVVLNLGPARAFHQTMVNDITSLAFSNVPDTSAKSASWSWVLRIDATGGYTFTNPPTVVWLDGSTWTDLDLTANAENVLAFKRVGVTTYASLLTNGTLRLDPYVFSFPDNGAQLVVVTRAETLGLGAVTNVEADGTAGTGTLTYKRNGSAVSGSTAFTAGQVLEVTMATSTTPSAVSIPRTV